MDFYAILGIAADADQETIRSAYRILARRYHPDRGAGSSTEKFRQVAEAYETLIEPARRQVYDLSLPRARRPAAVRAEPMMARPEPLHQELPEVFGRFRRAACSTASYGFHELLGEWIRSFEDDFFFDTLWR